MFEFFDIQSNALNAHLLLHEIGEKHFQGVRNKRINQVRIDKYQAVWSKLQSYWQANLTHIKSATQTAGELEKTDIYKDSEPKPVRAVIAKKVSAWKKALNTTS